MFIIYFYIRASLASRKIHKFWLGGPFKSPDTDNTEAVERFFCERLKGSRLIQLHLSKHFVGRKMLLAWSYSGP